MEIKGIHLIYFSATGSTQKVLRAFAAGTGLPISGETDVTTQPNMADLTVLGDELAVFGAPSFGGLVPAVATERFGHVHGQDIPAVVVTTYGNRAYEDTLLELSDTVKQNGFCPVGAAAVVTEHSIAHQFAAGRPDQGDCQTIGAFGAAIVEKLRGMTELSPLAEGAVKGNRPYKPLGVIPMMPKAGEGCNGCGVCASECPSGAISAEDPAKVDESRCISCMRCAAVCPQKERALREEQLAALSAKLEKVAGDRKENEFIL